MTTQAHEALEGVQPGEFIRMKVRTGLNGIQFGAHTEVTGRFLRADAQRVHYEDREGDVSSVLHGDVYDVSRPLRSQ